LHLTANGQDTLLDLQTAQFPINRPAQLSVKAIEKGPHSERVVYTYAIDCGSNYIQNTSFNVYDEDDNLIPEARDWPAIPGVRDWQAMARTISKQLYRGTCH
jgi:hypothetical protein